MVHPRQRNNVVPFSNFVPQQDLSNHLFSDPNRDCMQMFCSQEVDVPTYYFVVHKLLMIHLLWSCLGTPSPKEWCNPFAVLYS